MKRSASRLDTNRNAVRTSSTAGTARGEKARYATVIATGITTTARVAGSWKSGDRHSTTRARTCWLKVTPRALLYTPGPNGLRKVAALDATNVATIGPLA